MLVNGERLFKNFTIINSEVELNDQITSDTIAVNRYSKLITGDDLIVKDFEVLDSSVVSHKKTTTEIEYGLRIIAEKIYIDSTSAIDVSGLGYCGDRYINDSWQEASTNGNIPSYISSTSNNYVCGGTHGGIGGYSSKNPVPIYGSENNPWSSGSGGGAYKSSTIQYGGDGGGRIYLQSKHIVIEGLIAANGTIGRNYYHNGDGAGGSIWIIADSISGNGYLEANGGEYEELSHYSGGGGRIALNGCPISDSLHLSVNGFENGSISEICLEENPVKILFPATPYITNQSPIQIEWYVHGIRQQKQSIQELAPGLNVVIRSDTSETNVIYSDTVFITYDHIAPIVHITDPLVDTLFTQLSTITVAWEIDSLAQPDSAISLTEGINPVIFAVCDSAGNIGSDTIFIIKDTKPPKVVILEPANYATVLGDTVQVIWSADSIIQHYDTSFILNTDGANRIERVFTDRAGNSSIEWAYIYRGTRVPDIAGFTRDKADSIVYSKNLFLKEQWVDDTLQTTGTIVSQFPPAGDTIRLQMPVTASVALGKTAYDLIPLDVDANALLYDSRTTVMSGNVFVDFTNIGPSKITDSFMVLLFEDRNMNQIYDSTDNFIADTVIEGMQEVHDTLNLTIAIKDTVLFKGNPIYVMVDYKNSINEIDEENNMINSMATCQISPETRNIDPILEWKSNNGGQRGVPHVAQLNDDNNDGKIDSLDIPDIITIENYRWQSYKYTGSLCAYDGKTGKLHFIKKNTLFDWENFVSADINKDGHTEIVAIKRTLSSCEYAELEAFDHEGNTLWNTEKIFVGSVWFGGKQLSVSDFDHDGYGEIVWAQFIFDHNGKLIWTDSPSDINNPKRLSTLSNSYLIDLDMDGDNEIIISHGGPDGIIGPVAYRNTGEFLWGANLTNFNIEIISGNFDSDPYPELITRSSNAKSLLMLNNEGQIQKTIKTFSPAQYDPRIDTLFKGTPLVCDLNGDGSSEIVAIGSITEGIYAGIKSCIIAFNSSGTEMWRYLAGNTYDAGVSAFV